MGLRGVVAAWRYALCYAMLWWHAAYVEWLRALLLGAVEGELLPTLVEDKDCAPGGHAT